MILIIQHPGSKEVVEWSLGKQREQKNKRHNDLANKLKNLETKLQSEEADYQKA